MADPTVLVESEVLHRKWYLTGRTKAFPERRHAAKRRQIGLGFTAAFEFIIATKGRVWCGDNSWRCVHHIQGLGPGGRIDTPPQMLRSACPEDLSFAGKVPFSSSNRLLPSDCHRRAVDVEHMYLYVTVYLWRNKNISPSGRGLTRFPWYKITRLLRCAVYSTWST